MRNLGSAALLLAALCSASVEAMASPSASRNIRSVPFTIDRAGGIVVEARLNGEGPYRFLIDTGSARTVVSASLRERVGATVVAKSLVVSAGAEEWATIARIGSLSIGVAAVSDLDALVVSDRRLRGSAGAIDGIAGQDFLSRFNYLIDRERKIVLWNPTAAERPEGGASLPLVASEGRFLVEVAQANGESLMMVPDSGADALVLFTTRRAARLAMRPVGGEVRLASLTATRDVRRVEIARLVIGDQVLRNEPALVVASADAGSDGLLPLRAYTQLLFESGAKKLTLWQGRPRG